MSSNPSPILLPTVVPKQESTTAPSTPKSLMNICIHYLEDLRLAAQCPGAPRARQPHEGHIFNWEHVTV